MNITFRTIVKRLLRTKKQSLSLGAAAPGTTSGRAMRQVKTGRGRVGDALLRNSHKR